MLSKRAFNESDCSSTLLEAIVEAAAAIEASSDWIRYVCVCNKSEFIVA